MARSTRFKRSSTKPGEQFIIVKTTWKGNKRNDNLQAKANALPTVYTNEKDAFLAARDHAKRAMDTAAAKKKDVFTRFETHKLAGIDGFFAIGIEPKNGGVVRCM